MICHSIVEMTETICSVATCKSNSERAKKEGELIRFFIFPKNRQILKQWVHLCRRKSPFDPKNKRICSKHFVLNQYEDEIEAQVKNTMPKRLKETAIPSLNLPLLPEDNISERSKRMILKEQKRIVENLLIDEDAKRNDLTQDMPACSSNSILQDNQAQQDKEEMENLIATNKQLQLSADRNEKTLDAKVKDVLGDFFTQNQIEVLLKNKTKARWTSEEISKAFTLRYLSKRTYIYFRETLKYPLPGISTLQRWASNIDLQQGMLKDV